MAINFKKFEKWAISKFGEDNVLTKGNEIRINSIFEEDDTGHHMWCNPSGGKRKHPHGVFHCFKTDKKGSLVKLVQIVSGCDREDAIDILQGRTPIKDLEKKLEEFFSIPSSKEEVKKNKINFPVGCKLISNLPTNNWWRKRAESYLLERKIPIKGLYVCTEGTYKNRIIIPYYDKDNSLIYFNGRTLGKSKCKYLGPPKDIGVGKEDVVFMAGSWPKQGETIYLCEGEFNAMTLKICELNGAACGGKNMSKKQAIMLSDYKIVICLDRDKAGKAGTIKMTSIITSMETSKSGEEKLKYVMPPKKYNDWNEFLVDESPELVYHYISKNQKNIDYSGPTGTTSDFFGYSEI